MINYYIAGSGNRYIIPSHRDPQASSPDAYLNLTGRTAFSTLLGRWDIEPRARNRL